MKVGMTFSGVRAVARRVYRFLRALTFALLLAAAVLGLEIYRYSTQSSSRSADAALVLGAAVNDRAPSPVLVERLRHAAALYQSGRVHTIVVTGGRSPEDELSEAAASRRWLRAEGVPARDIVLENRSRTTIENLAFAAPLLETNNITTVLLVSDPLHMRRASLIAARLGLTAWPSPTPTTRYQSWRTRWPFLVREIRLSAKYLVLGT